MPDTLPTYSRWATVPDELKTMTQWKAARRTLRRGATPRAEFHSTYYHRWYDLYSIEDTTGIRRRIVRAPEVLAYSEENLSSALCTINDTAKRRRDSASAAYEVGRHHFAKKYSIEKTEYYELKDAVLERLIEQGRAEQLGYHSKTDYRDPAKPRWRFTGFSGRNDWHEFNFEFEDDLFEEFEDDVEFDEPRKVKTVLEVIEFGSRLFHRPVNLAASDTQITKHLGDKLSPARPLGSIRLCDAEFTLREYLRQPCILLPMAVTDIAATVGDGDVIRALAIPWLRICQEILKNPRFLLEYSQHPRNFEEFIAASYSQAGFDEVVLTPRSNDFGRDVIAIKKGIITVRVLDQCKAHSAGHVVTANDVRAMLGVLTGDRNSSKAFVTTTATFAPGIEHDPFIAPFMPYRLQLRDGRGVRSMLEKITGAESIDL